MSGSNLDYDILNDVNYLDDFDFESDFDLFPMDVDFGLDSFSDVNFFPDLEPQPLLDVPPTNQKPRCEYCSKSFRRKCELKSHVHKHTKPFKCTQPGCKAAYAENRRRVQHMKTAHGLALDKDFRKCQLCDYASIRPDALKRHMLTHGMHVIVKPGTPSPATVSSEQVDE